MDEQRKVIEMQDDDEIEIDLGLLLSGMWKGLKKLWWLVLLLICLGAGGALVFTRVFTEPMYRCSATFTVAIGDGESATYSYYYNQNAADQLSLTFPYILDSGFFRSSLLSALGTDSLNGTITAETIEESNVVTMTAESPDAQDAYDILNAAMDIYPETARFVLGEIRFSLLDEPQVPSQPYNQVSMKRSLALGGGGGALVSLCILGLLSMFRGTVRNAEEMKKITSLRCLAAVPAVRFKARGKQSRQNLSVLEERTPFGYRESIRALQIRAEKALKNREGRVLLVTSTEPGEGKSTLAVGLAEMFASKGSRVLLIDGDLRKQDDARLVGRRGGAGLAEAVRGDQPAGELIRRNRKSGMWFLGGNRPMKQPASVLSSPDLNRVIRELREKMDYIIIDSPPCGMFQDAGILADCADGILYVVKYDCVSRGKIREGISSLQGRNAVFLGYAFNEYPESSSEYGYGRYGYGAYGQGKYGYGYGYGAQSRGAQKGKAEASDDD